MRRLAEIAPPGSITPLIFVDLAPHVLAMAAVPQPHENWKAVLLAGRIEADHVRQFAQILGAIHAGGHARRDQFASEFADQSFFESLRLEPYYAYSAQQHPPAASFLHQLIEETRSIRQTLVHGDFSPKNVLVHEGRLILLDHEVVHFGDGAFDIGFSMTHLLSKAHAQPAKRQDFLAAASLFWREYFQIVRNVPWAGDLEARACRHTLACMLARCVGRSPLEYLTPEMSRAQTAAITRLMQLPPATIEKLIHEFERQLAGGSLD
jgi:hypothetical protein